MVIDRRAFAAGLAMVPVAAALGPGAAAQRAGERRSLVVATPNYPAALDPVLNNFNSTMQTIYGVHDRLLRFDHLDGMRLRPALAESWERLAPTVVELQLRPGVRFHDGTLVSVDDVVFSFSDARLKGPGGSGQTVALQYLRTFARVEAVDATRIRVVTATPDPLIEQRLAGWTAEIVSRRAFEAAGGWDGWARRPVGTGPYKITEARQDVRLVLEAHDAYWMGQPPLARIEFRIVPEAASRVNGLLAGDFDLAVEILPDQFAAIERRPELEVVGGAIASIRTLNFDTTHGWLRDVRVRRALSLAIDRDLLIRSLWAGRVDVPNGFQNPAFGPVYDPGFATPGYDPETARQLVREAGYRGEPIAYRTQPNAYPFQIPTAQALAEMWRAVGLNVQITVMENWSQIWQRPIDAIFDGGTLMAYPDPAGMLWRLYNPDGNIQRVVGAWANPEFNRVGGELEGAFEPERRRALSRRLMQIVEYDDPGCIILWNHGVFHGKAKGFAWRPYPSFYLDFGPANGSIRR